MEKIPTPKGGSDGLVSVVTIIETTENKEYDNGNDDDNDDTVTVKEATSVPPHSRTPSDMMSISTYVVWNHLATGWVDKLVESEYD